VDGTYHTLALNNLGQVWGWGTNEYCQVEPGDSQTRKTPVKLDLENIQSIACTNTSSAAVDSQGRVWFWGGDLSYKGSEISLIKTSVPTHIPELDGARSLISNEDSFTILTQDGQVKTWGNDCIPVTVTGLPRIVQISQGENHYLALDEQGRVWSWGTNIDLLGYSRTDPTDRTSRMIPELPPIVAISSGYNHALALDNQGRVWSWGIFSELAGRTTSDPDQASITMPIIELDNIVEIKCRQNTSVALRDDGAIFTWSFDIGTYVGHTFVHRHERLNIPSECGQCHLEC
jgi:alpha-tubulin suppressor-like RCC1 family protein